MIASRKTHDSILRAASPYLRELPRTSPLFLLAQRAKPQIPRSQIPRSQRTWLPLSLCCALWVCCPFNLIAQESDPNRNNDKDKVQKSTQNNAAPSAAAPSPAASSPAPTDHRDFKAEIESFLDADSSNSHSNSDNRLSVDDRAASEKPESNQTDQTATKFLRLQTRGDEPQSLDTAVVTYRASAANGAQVDLIGAVHIGEASYYAKLNQLFDQYDVLLYELVAPEGTKIPRGGQRKDQGFNPVAMLQDASKDMLGLESQLEHINYTKRHFVRADMTPTQIAEKMAERGDTAFTLALDTLADVMRQQNLATQSSNSNTLGGLDQNVSLSDMFGNPLKMKRLMAAQFASTGSLDQAMGKSLNQLLIKDRNAEALKGLQRQLAAGKKKIGIFYGAAHLPDFERHLIEDFGLVRTSQQWLPAWDLTSAKKSEVSEPVGLLLNVLELFE